MGHFLFYLRLNDLNQIVNCENLFSVLFYSTKMNGFLQFFYIGLYVCLSSYFSILRIKPLYTHLVFSETKNPEHKFSRQDFLKFYGGKKYKNETTNYILLKILVCVTEVHLLRYLYMYFVHSIKSLSSSPPGKSTATWSEGENSNINKK